MYPTLVSARSVSVEMRPGMCISCVIINLLQVTPGTSIILAAATSNDAHRLLHQSLPSLEISM